MHPTQACEPPGPWLLDGGIRQVELLLRAIVYPPSELILITDDERNCRDASCGTGKLLGLSRDRVIGHKIDDFIEPGSRAQAGEELQALIGAGDGPGHVRLLGPDGTTQEFDYTVKGNVLPGRHAVVLHAQNAREATKLAALASDFAVYILDVDGRILSWFGGAERLYGYQSREIAGQNVGVLLPDSRPGKQDEELKKAAARGYFGIERWKTRKDGTRFWANILTMALRSEDGKLQGFARVVRDFSDHHSSETKLPHGGVPDRSHSPHAAECTGVVCGEFDHILRANDAFLEMFGYSREELTGGQLLWSRLTATDSPLDERAYEEALLYGACAPFRKTYVCKDGTRVSVEVTFAVLNLAPFHWIAVVHVLGGKDGGERAGEIPGVSDRFNEIVGRSAGMRRVLKLVETVAPTDATVLILGETGTGKELVARAVHRLSRRKNFPFVTLNCAAIPTGLLESELFGHERGAFTGALAQKMGRFEMANRGTLFLDEVGDIPLELQPKLLRALQEKSFERLGGTRTIPIDVRLVAATNRDLAEMLAEKSFRSDLYYRLKVFPITTLPLRERPEDIPALAYYFMQKYSKELGKQVELISPETMRALVSWSWPGNVRELENLIERSVILSTSNVLHALPDEFLADDVRKAGTLEEVERDYILQVLREANGVISAAAMRLGIQRTTLNAKMHKLRISRKDI